MIAKNLLFSTPLAVTQPTQYAQWETNPAQGIWSLSNNNATILHPNQGNSTHKATLAKTSGKIYCEILSGPGGFSTHTRVGIANDAKSINQLPGSDVNGSHIGPNGSKHMGASTGGVAISVGDIIMLAMNIDTKKLWYGKNGVWLSGGNPSAGTTPSFSTLPAGAIRIAAGGFGGAVVLTGNFGQSPFTYSVPQGFDSGIFI